MIQKITDKAYHFITLFNSETGAYVRSGILDESGKDTGIDPFQASFPHLIDVGVMGHCRHGQSGLCTRAGIGCYQSGPIVSRPNMRLADFKRIAEECCGRVNQFALGGRGDPDQHEDFEAILKICRENDVVPNFTTSGLGMTPALTALCRAYCGAVAVSWYRSDYTLRAIDMLLEAGVKTNIHYVLGKNSLEEALDRLHGNAFPRGVNAVVFLLHKPAGLGSAENVLSTGDVSEFFAALEAPHPFKVGMDSCNVPGALQYCQNVMPESLDTCEDARFSCYIDSDMTMVPCSFDQSRRYAVSLKEQSIEDAWNSAPFEAFREHLKTACPGCADRALCMGGCPLFPQIVLCRRAERSI